MIRDDYAGPGGWSEGLRLLGLTDVGIERDPDACATRAANGHATIRADLSTYSTPADRITGYIASPPCQTFSAAGKGDGRRDLAALVDIIGRGAYDEAAKLDERTAHVAHVARSAVVDLHPQWIALEQVPSVLPAWEAIAAGLRARGYSTWTGVLNAADYGVPQTRRRAILVASRVREVTRPRATHAEHPDRAINLFSPDRLPPWATMLDALGDAFAARLTDTGLLPPRWRWVADRPARSITGTPGGVGGRMGSGAPGTGRATADGSEHVNVTLAEALVLQSFRRDYMIAGATAGSRWQQVGNAIPPRLAAHVAAEAAGRRGDRVTAALNRAARSADGSTMHHRHAAAILYRHGHHLEARRLELAATRLETGLPLVAERPAAETAIATAGIARALELARRLAPLRPTR